MTTENSRADALTDDFVKRAFYAADCKTWYEAYPSAAMDVAHAILAASPVEQPAAAPSGYCERAGDCVCGGDLPRVREGCSEWVKSKPAPSPADERAAFLSDDEYCDLQAAVQALELIASGMTYAKDHDLDGTMQKATIRDAMRHAKNALRRLNPVYHKLADTWQEARAASDNETVPKWVFDNLVNTLQPAWDYIQTHQEQFSAQAGDDKNAILVEFFLRAASANETGAEVTRPSGYAYRYRSLGGTVIRFNGGGEVNGSRPIEAIPYWFAAPQPAQADARVELTDGRIARLRAAIEGECDGLHVDYHHAKAILAYLDDDRA